MPISFNSFQEKYGILLVDEPDPKAVVHEAIEKEMDDLYHQSRQAPLKSIPRIEAVIKQCPEECAAYNFLFVAYALSRQNAKASEVLDLTIKKFPDYLLGPANLITFNIKNRQEVLKKAHLLGPNLSITDWPKDSRGAYHITHFIAFEKAAVTVLMYQEKLPEAKERFSRLMELGVTEEELSPLLDIYQVVSIDLVLEEEERQDHKRITPPSRCTLDYREDYLTLEIDEGPLDELWHLYPERVDAELLNRMLALPRETVISSAQRVLYVALTVFQATETRYVFEDDIETHSIMAQHALFLLAMTEATEALPEVLDFARLEARGFNSMFGDYVNEYYMVALITLGRHHPALLNDYLYEPHHESFCRFYVASALEQIAHREPRLREQIIAYFADWLNTMLAGDDHNPLLDTALVTQVVNLLVKLRADHLLPLLRRINDRGYIQDKYIGDINIIEQEIQWLPDPADVMPLPENPMEYYNFDYQLRKPKSIYKTNVKIDEFDDMMTSRMLGGLAKILASAEELPEPPRVIKKKAPKLIPVRTGKKVGRNDPCPCGSGLKYKKCCLGK